MFANQIGIVLCRVGAAVLLVQAIRSLGQLLPGIIFGFGEFSTEILVLSMTGFVPGLAAIGLWVFADRISRIPGSSGNCEVQQLLSNVDLVRMGTALIGIYLIVTGVVSGTAIEVASALRPNIDGMSQSVEVSESAKAVGARAAYLVQLVLGVLLVIGRRIISTSLEKAKYAATGTSP